MLTKSTIIVLVLLILSAGVTAIDLGTKLSTHIVKFPLHPALDTTVYARPIVPDSCTVAVWAVTGTDTTGQVIYGVSSTTPATVGVKRDSVGTNTPIWVFADTVRLLNAGTAARMIAGEVLLWHKGCPFTTSFTLTVAADSTAEANSIKIGGMIQTGRDIGANVLLSSGTGAGQINLSSGAVTVADTTNLSKLITVLKAAIDTIGYQSGYKPGAWSRLGRGTDYDTLFMGVGDVIYWQMLMKHIGGATGDTPDSTRASYAP